MDYSDADPSFRARFLQPKFDPELFIQSIASQSIGSTDLSNIKRRMHLIASDARTDLKQDVYRNHTKFIETAKQVATLESEVYQLHSLLADEKQLLDNVKDLLNIENKPESSETSDADSWEPLLHHCHNLGLVSANSDRRLLYSGKLHDVKLETPSSTQYKSDGMNKYVTSPCYGLLFNDGFIIVKSTSIRTATAYDVDQVIKFYRDSTDNSEQRPSSIKIINVKDDVIRNSFIIKYNLEIITMMCDNSQLKKHWIEMFESVLHPDSTRFSLIPAMESRERTLEEEFFSDEWITNSLEDLTILLAERNFDEALILLLKSRKYVQQFLSEHEQQSITFFDDYTKNLQEKEQDLYKLIEKEVLYICERGCSMNSLKYYYHHIQILKQLGYVPKACDLFFTIQFSLMKTTLKQTKLEELNVVFVENFANTFFTRLVECYYEFVQIFKDQKSTFTKFIVWMATEIEKLITILHNQQYISTRNFTFSMKNIDVLLKKAEEFSLTLIDIKFIFEEHLGPLLIQIIRSQKELIINTLRQRHRDEKWIPITFQTHEHLDQLFFEFQELGVHSQHFLQPFIIKNDKQNLIQIDLAPSTLQFSKAYLTFARDLYSTHYLSINYLIVEALVELIKLHLKYYERTLQKSGDIHLTNFIMKNVDFSINYLFYHVDQLYRPKIGNSAKFFTKVYDKMDKLKEMSEY